MDIATKTTGGFGPAVGYFATIDNDDGEGTAFLVSKAEGSSDAHGLLVESVESTGTGNDAYGVKIEDVQGEAVSGVGYGVYVNGIAGSTQWGVYVADTAPNFMQGVLRLGNSTGGSPTNAVELRSLDLTGGNTMLGIVTEGTPIGSGTPAQNRTVAIDVNGTTYYLHASLAAA